MIVFRTVAQQYAAVDKMLDYTKSSNYRNGARWNSAGIPALYLSTNVQNAMLELANYVDDPETANLSSVIAIYQIDDELRLDEIAPKQLTDDWNVYPYPPSLQKLGDTILTSPNYDGLIAPSIAINDAVARSNINTIRQSCYANLIINPTNTIVRSMKLIDTCDPIYSERMFSSL